MALVACITDQHFGARNNSPVVHTHMGRFYEKVFFPVLDEYGITTILNGGDYFDNRTHVNIGTASFVTTQYRDEIKRRGIHEHVIVGNHDVFYKYTNKINALSEFYRLEPNLTIYTEPQDLEIDGRSILLLPWMTPENQALSDSLIQTSQSQVVLGHLALAGFQMYRGMPAHDGLDPTKFGRFSLVMTGHYHHKSTNDPIHYLGAPYPMIWSDYDDPRGFHLLDTDTLELTFVPNPYTMFVRLVYDDIGKKSQYCKDIIRDIMDKEQSPYRNAYVKVVVRSKENPYWFDVIMDALSKVNAQDVTVVDDIVVDDTPLSVEHVTQDIDTLSLMREFITDASFAVNRDDMMRYFTSIYEEAIHKEELARTE